MLSHSAAMKRVKRSTEDCPGLNVGRHFPPRQWNSAVGLDHLAILVELLFKVNNLGIIPGKIAAELMSFLAGQLNLTDKAKEKKSL